MPITASSLSLLDPHKCTPDIMDDADSMINDGTARDKLAIDIEQKAYP